MNHPTVFTLILNYNGWRDTVECLESVQRLNYPNYRIVVIDNGSSDGSMDKIKAWAAGELPVESKFFTYDPSTKPVHWIEYDRATAEADGLPELEAEIEALPPNRRMVLIQTGANLGYAGGNNVGIRYALKRGANYVWILNNDTVAQPDALLEMVRLAESNKQVGIVGAKILYYDQPRLIQAAGGMWVSRWQGMSYHYGRFEDASYWINAFEPEYVSGASMLIRILASDAESDYFMEESFFLYWEEADWQQRLKKKGKRLLYAPNAIVYHKESSSVGSKTPKQEFFYTRNAIYFARLHFPWTIPTISIVHLLRAVKRALRGEWQRGIGILKGIAAGLTYNASSWRKQPGVGSNGSKDYRGQTSVPRR
ncbi:MAG: glycosyltransferase family 2 protein [Bacillota bacterium]